MTSQGFFGALWQYWNIQPKVRLERRNTCFEEEVSNADALRFCLFSSMVIISIISFWCILEVIL